MTTYQVFDGDKTLGEFEDFKDAYDTAVKALDEKSFYYVRAWIQDSVLTYDYGSHWDFVKIVSDGSNEELSAEFGAVMVEED